MDELRRFDQRRGDDRRFTATLGADKEVVFAAEGEGSLGFYAPPTSVSEKSKVKKAF